MTKANTKLSFRDAAPRLRWSAALAALAIGLTAASSARAQFNSAIDLSSLAPATGLRLIGAAANDQLGAVAVAAGDVNGDGIDDIIVNAVLADPNGSASGAAYVVFGTRTMPASPFEVSSLNGSNGFRLAGKKADDLATRDVSAAGDVNGDGFDDLLLGAPFTSPEGNFSGTAYVVFGKASGFAATVQLSNLNGNNGFRIIGRKAEDFAGGSIAAAGDVNGDGLDDILVGASGEDPHGSRSGAAYVIFGKKSGWNAKFKLTAINGNNGVRLKGTAAQDYFGGEVSGAGDINGDGFDDIMVGAAGVDLTPGVEPGFVYVMFGKGGGFNAAIEASALTGAKGFRIAGPEHESGLGYALAGGGDINGDGFDDILLGANKADYNVSPVGVSYVIFGKSAAFTSPFDLAALDGTNGFHLNGVFANDSSGRAVATGFDINGDGFDDMVVGSPSADPNGNASGRTHVIFGKTDLASRINLEFLNGTTGFRLEGEADADSSGFSVGSAGDFNGDGIGDVVVGAPGADPLGRTYAGAAYVVLGRTPTTIAIRQGSAAGQYISGGSAPDVLAALGGNDVLEGRGDAIDTLSGGIGNDTASYKHAPAAVIASLSDNSLNTGDAEGRCL